MPGGMTTDIGVPYFLVKRPVENRTTCGNVENIIAASEIACSCVYRHESTWPRVAAARLPAQRMITDDLIGRLSDSRRREIAFHVHNISVGSWYLSRGVN